MSNIETVFQFISVSYFVSVILAVYLVIRFIDSFRKKGLSKAMKKVVSLVVGAIIAIIYIKYKIATLEDIIPSYLLSIVVYDYAIKNILSRVTVLKHKE